MSAQARFSRSQQYSQRVLGILSFAILLSVGIGGFILWRLPNAEVVAVHGSAMAPLIHEGDAVVINKQAAIRQGDIITYANPQDLTDTMTARVASYDSSKNVFITQGEGDAKASLPITKDLLIGRVDYHVLKLGYVLDFLHSPAGLIAAIYLPAAIIVGRELQRIKEYYAAPTYRLARNIKASR